MPNNNNNFAASSARRSTAGTLVRIQSATRGHAKDNELFVWQIQKLQGTNLNTALTPQAGQVDNKYTSDIETAMLQWKDVTIKATPATTTITEFDRTFYPGDVPDQKANLFEQGMYAYRRR